MADLIYSGGLGDARRKTQKWMNQQNVKLCMQNGKQDVEISDIGDNENFSSLIKNFANNLLNRNFKEVVSNPEDLIRMRESFVKIKTCVEGSSDNNPKAIELIDRCEIFVDNGQLSDYKDCLMGESYKVHSIEF